MIARFLRPVLTPCRSCGATCSGGHTHACRGRTWVLTEVFRLRTMNRNDSPPVTMGIVWEKTAASWDGRGAVRAPGERR